MSARILDGKKLAQTILAEIAHEVVDFIQNYGTEPTLAAVLVGENPASEVYVRNKRRECEKAGIRYLRAGTVMRNDKFTQMMTELILACMGTCPTGTRSTLNRK